MDTRQRATSSLDDLADCDPDELMEMYRSARTPRLEHYSRSPLFPWQGKTFAHETASHGHGVNRLLGERVTWFHFETSIGPSDAGAHLGCFFGIARQRD